MIVIDSGIWISAIEFGGTPSAAIELAVQIDDLAICTEIENEVLRILEEKFGRNRESIRSRIAPFWNSALRIQITGSVKGVCRDPGDDPILECAIKARANVLISGDKDLLSLKSYERVHILTAREFINLHT